MFGGFGQPSSSPFGQSTSSPFGQSLFGQNNNNNTNPFAPQPFGSPTANPFGSQTGGSIFGGTSTGVFGQTPSPLATAPTFGASSSPAFGSSTPAFGASTTPAFGAASSAFGGSSLFGQKPAFGGFGSTTGQSNPFGSSFQQTQPTFGSSPFGSTTSFGASSQPAFGASSTPAFGASTVPSFGATSTPAFGATAPTFGSTTTPAFGSTTTPAFGATTTPAFGAATTPAFGSTTFGTQGTTFGFSTPTFGSTPSFGSGSSPIFGASTTPAFGTSSTSAFGAPSTSSFSFSSAPAFGQSTPAFGTTTFGTTSFGGQSTTPAFGSTVFGQSTFGQQAGQQGGSRLAPYAPTVDADGATGTQPAGKLESISAMPVYKEKSHEELRWEDYQRGDKGGPNPAGQPAAGVGFPAATQTNPFGQTGAFGQTTASSFSSTSAGLFGQKPAFPSTGFGQTTGAFSSPFGTASSSPFGSSSSTSLFGGQSAPGFSASTTPLFGSTAAPFGAVSSFGSQPASLTTTFNTGLNFNTQSAGLFQSSATGQTSLFGQTSGFGQLPGSNIFGAQSTGFGSIFGTSSSLAPSTPMGFSQTTPSLSSPFQPATPVPASGGFSFGNFGQSQPVASGFAGISNIFGQNNAQPTTQTSVVLQPTSITNPFGTLPAMPQMSIGRAGASSSIQYGISNMPVSEKPIPVRVSSLLTPRHLSQRRVKLPSRKYSSKTDSPKVAFFYDEEGPPSTPKADALFIPRENPRALVIRPVEQWPSRNINEKNLFTVVRENGKVAGDVPVTAEKGSISNGGDGNIVQRQDNDRSKSPPETNGFEDDYHAKGFDSSTSSYTLFTGKRAGEAAIVYEHGADIEALMPKLRHPEYYTEPQIPELAAKERAVPGFCRHVKDFVVGRHGYGNIKFEGETDVRRLDLESLVQFNNREVIVYKDENKKPPIGQGLNKPAEVTLLNVKCADRKTGRQYTEGSKVENYRELLRKKAEEQGAKFVSYDPLKGEWKFKVDHFSSYGFGEVSGSLLTAISELEGDKQKLSAS